MFGKREDLLVQLLIFSRSANGGLPFNAEGTETVTDDYNDKNSKWNISEAEAEKAVIELDDYLEAKFEAEYRAAQSKGISVRDAVLDAIQNNVELGLGDYAGEYGAAFDALVPYWVSMGIDYHPDDVYGYVLSQLNRSIKEEIEYQTSQKLNEEPLPF